MNEKITNYDSAMIQTTTKKINDSLVARWSALILSSENASRNFGKFVGLSVGSIFFIPFSACAPLGRV